MDYAFFIAIVLAFLTGFLLLEGLYLSWESYRGAERKNIMRRLRVMEVGDGEQVPLLKREHRLAKHPALEALLQRTPFIHELDALIMRAGVHYTVAMLIGVMLLLGAVGVSLAALASLPLLMSVLVGLVLLSIPVLYVIKLGKDRLHEIETQLPDALDLISRAMRAGHAFVSAMRMVRDEMQEPIAEEFGITFDEINYGISIQDALANLSKRVPSTDIRYFVISVLVQRQTGGNLTELLGNISTLIRARLKLLGAVRVLATEGRVSAWILGILPFAVAFAINLINPDFLSVLWTDPAGIKMTATSLLIMVLGIYWMWRIIKIRI